MAYAKLKRKRPISPEADEDEDLTPVATRSLYLDQIRRYVESRYRLSNDDLSSVDELYDVESNRYGLFVQTTVLTHDPSDPTWYSGVVRLVLVDMVISTPRFLLRPFPSVLHYDAPDQICDAETGFEWIAPCMLRIYSKVEDDDENNPTFQEGRCTGDYVWDVRLTKKVLGPMLMDSLNSVKVLAELVMEYVVTSLADVQSLFRSPEKARERVRTLKAAIVIVTDSDEADSSEEEPVAAGEADEDEEEVNEGDEEEGEGDEGEWSSSSSSSSGDEETGSKEVRPTCDADLSSLMCDVTSGQRYSCSHPLCSKMVCKTCARKLGVSASFGDFYYYTAANCPWKDSHYGR